MKPKSDKSIELYKMMLSLGYPEEFCDIITKNLNTDFTAKRMMGYLRNVKHPSLEELADEMQLEGEDLVSLERALESLEKEAAVIRNRHDLYGVPERMNLVVGRLSMTGKGFGFVVPENKEPEETDVFIPGRKYRSKAT
jgi:ribonuclease R